MAPTRVLFLAAALVVAMLVLPSCHAREECGPIIPCRDTTCLVFCQQLGFINPRFRCVDGAQGQYDQCCCSSKNSMDDDDAAAAAALPPAAAISR